MSQYASAHQEIGAYRSCPGHIPHGSDAKAGKKRIEVAAHGRGKAAKL
jgi:hypothetical protein